MGTNSIRALAGALVAAGCTAGAAPLQDGQPFPRTPLPLAEDDGALHSVAGFLGRPMVVHVFASW